MSRRGEIAKEILKGIGLVGLVVASLALPNLPRVLRLTDRNYTKQQVYNSFYNLKRQGLVKVSVGKSGKETVVKLTSRGKDKVLKFKFEGLKIKKLDKWDKKWRLVIFDVPEDFKNNRTYFVKKLKKMGLRPLQKSVWVSPWPCQDEIDFIKEIFLIRKYLRVVVAESIDRQNDLIKEFNLNF